MFPKMFQKNKSMHVHSVWEAARLGDLESLKCSKLPLSQPDEYGNHPVHTASKSGHLPVVKFLASKGVPLDKPGWNGNHPVHFASKSGHLPVVEFLASKGVPLDRCDKYGHHPVHQASRNGHLPVVEFLTRQDGTGGGQPLGVRDREGRTIGDVAIGSVMGWWKSEEVQARLRAEAGGVCPPSWTWTSKHPPAPGPLPPSAAAPPPPSAPPAASAPAIPHPAPAPAQAHAPAPAPAALGQAGSAVRTDLFENDGRPMGMLPVPTSNEGLSLGESLKQVGGVLGVWGKWQQVVPDLLANAEIVAAQDGEDLAQRIGNPEMAAAITVYTSETHLDSEDQIYCRLTQCLRERKKGEVRAWGPFLYYLLTGLGRLDSFVGQVFRGVGEEVKNLKFYATGKMVVWTTMSSTSTNRKEAEKFLHEKLRDGGVGTFFAINTPAGKRISELSMVPSEDEVLLPMNSRFIVASKERVQQELPNGRGQATVWVITMVQQGEGGEVWG